MKIVWDQILEEVSRQIPPQYYDSFISPLTLLEISSEKVTLSAPSGTIKSHVEKKYLKYLEDAVYTIAGNRIFFEITLESDKNSFKDIVSERYESQDSFEFNPDYTFQKFITGDSNRTAFTAAKETALKSAEINPLYIFGKVGVGKTHLLHSIAWEIKNNSPWKSVKYIDILSFMNEFTFMVSNRQNLESFKMKYQSYDVLLVDDIQYLNSSAEKTQEMFFYFFNYLYDRKRQIVIASDRPSFELPIQERLKSRFVTGFQVDIKPPDTEIRMKILKRYSESLNLNLSNEIISYIANSIQGDIRSLLGALNDLNIYKKSFGLLFFKIETVEEIISNRLVKSTSSEFDYEFLIDTVCETFGQHRKDILGKSRKSEFIIPRHISIYLLNEIYNLNKTVTGRLFQIKHTAVIHAIRKVEELKKSDPSVKQKIDSIRSKISFK